MESLPPLTDIRAIENEVRAQWRDRRLPRPDGTLGPESGAPIRPVLAGGAANESPSERLHRVVAVDVDSRAAAIRGRRVASAPRLAARLADRSGRAEVDQWGALGVWMVDHGPEAGLATSATRGIVQELARAGVIVRGEGPVRHCASCRIPRTPETIVYQEELGNAYLVRFPVRGASSPTSLIVWTDSVWKLLGTVALLVSPELPYVAARFERRGSQETILVARGALERLVGWLPGSSLEVLEERAGSGWVETAYDHPLQTEYPALANITSPGGTVLATAEVGDSGTGIVPLVPAHGATDWALARSLRLSAMPVIGLDGLPLPQLLHKYAGLPLDALEAFALRDLTEGGYIFAQLRVRRGIPRCAVCGTALQWVPTPYWALEPGRLSADLLALYTRLFPGEPAPPVPEPIPWPAASTVSELATAVALSECQRCERLAPEGAQGPCPCGGERQPSRRELLPAFADAVDQWARMVPVPPGELLRLHVPDRRRVPAVLHHLAAMEGAGARPGEVRIVRLPRAALADTEGSLAEGEPADALRAALVRGWTDEGILPESFPSVRRQEARRLRRYWDVAAGLIGRMAAAGFAPDLPSLGAHLAELAVEDRALLSVFERMRLEVERAYDSGQFARALARLHAFWEQDFVDGYLALAGPRLEAGADPTLQLSAYRTVAHVLCVWNALLGPVAPHLAERIDRSLRGAGRSLFERTIPPAVDAALVPALETAFHRWLRLRGAIPQALRRLGLPPTTRFEELIVQVHDEAIADELRTHRDALARFLPTNALEIASPNYPWAGRRLEARPVLEEIRRVYPAQEARIVRLLHQLPARRLRDGLASNSLQVALQGHPTPILPGMVEFIEGLPEGFLKLPWGPGELYVRMAPSARPPERLGPADPSLGGFQRVVASAIRRLPAEGRPAGTVLVVAGADFAERLTELADVVATRLGVGMVRVVPSPPRPPLRKIAHGGRGRRGRWEAWALVGGSAARRPRPRLTARPRRRRVLSRTTPWAAEESVLEYLSMATRDREEAMRQTSDRLDALVGRPIFGPTKVAVAWTIGLTSYESIVDAPFEQLESIPGFGHFVAAELVRQRGEAPPPRPSSLPEPARHAEPTSSPVDAGAARETPAPEEARPTAGPHAVPPPAERPAPPTAPASTAPPAPLPTPSPARAEPVPRPDLLPAPPVPPTLPPGSRSGPGPTVSPASVSPIAAGAATAPRPPALEASAPAAPTPGPASVPGVRLWLTDHIGAWRRFLDLTTDSRGLCLSREFPDRIRTLVGPRSVDVVWLSSVVRPNAIRPSDLAALSHRLAQAMGEQGVRAVYLDGGEYLVSVLGAERALQLLSTASELAAAHGAQVLVPLDASLLAPAALTRLREAFPTDEPSA